jgi:RsiW-degrading membrane proteinase PrsW (M82 family)
MEILIAILLILAVGIVPMVVYAMILWWFDRYEKEPLALLIAAFAWGAIPSIIFSLIAELVLDIPVSYFVEPMAADLIGAAVIAPITEEMFKGAVLWSWLVAAIINRLLMQVAPQLFKRGASRLLLRILFPPFFQELESPLDGIIYGGLVGFGFAAVENVFYFISVFAEGGIGAMVLNMVFRAFIFGLNHALFTGLIGLGLALARTARSWIVKIGAPIMGLVLGIVAHGIHNASVSFVDLCWPCLITLVSDWGGVLIMFVIIVWTTVRERRWIVTYLADEVQMGTLSKQDYEVVCSYLKRVSTRMGALFRGNFKRWWRLGSYHRLATELAFNKQRLTKFPEEKDTQQRIVTLRDQVKELGGEVGLGRRTAGVARAGAQRGEQGARQPEASARAWRYCASCGRAYRRDEDELVNCPVCGAPRAGRPGS